MVLADVVGISACTCAATWIASGFVGVPAASTMLIIAAAVVLTIPIAWQQGLYRSIIRYIGLDLFVAGSRTAILVAIVMGGIVLAAGLLPDPGLWSLAFGAFALIYVIGGRFIARIFLNSRLGTREPILIYGAGEGGARLAAALKNGNEFEPVAMVDDNLLMHGKRVNGVEVYSPASISRLIDESQATRVLLAMPSASRHRRRDVLERLSDFPVHVQTIPEISDLVTGKARVDDIRDVDVTDLLGRDAVPPDMKLLRASIAGKSVMVTGAGGSIGSELCRQIIHLGPKCLVLFEISEIALYSIEKELRYTATSEGIDCEIVSLLGSVHHKDRVSETLQTFQVCTVYHAAAYKHVPVVEHNLLEGVHNNVFGTLYVAEAAVNTGVETFVLISTDKAVSPTSVMGATKRMAELTLQALQDEHPSVRFSMVRFGNVLASSGSVVPLFREQIRSGGPVTVTHREIIRYFMTIPEAAQLVIQAGAMAKGGDVFVLDMGRPVKIRDLARRMINLMGLTVRDEHNPDGDIAIEYTGLRPGEKLYEELLIGNDVSGTNHPRIMRASEHYIPMDELRPLFDELGAAARDLDRNRARELLKRVVAGYKPTNGIDDLIWVRSHGVADDEDEDKVVDISTRRA
ncbi:MAG: polysaccharide biosynthesis protein [Woeseiaceae bacterium]